MDTIFKDCDKVSLKIIKGSDKFSRDERNSITKEIGQGVRFGLFHRRKYNCIFTLIHGVYNVHIFYRENVNKIDKKGRFVLIKTNSK